MFDYHVHSQFSPDAGMTMLEACARAVEIGIKEIAFTDHLDYHYPGSPLKWEFSYSEYVSEVKRCEALHSGRLTVLRGVEVGMNPAAHERNTAFVTNNAFDFVIGSVHIVGDQDLDNGEFFQGRDLEEAGRLYLEAVNKNVRTFTHFDVLGHADLFKRYLHFLSRTPRDIQWPLYREVIGDTLKTLITTGRGMELNMSGYRTDLCCTYPGLEMLKLYRDLGGEIVTLASDAHYPQHVGLRFDVGRKILREAGFRYLTTYRERQPRFVPIP